MSGSLTITFSPQLAALIRKKASDDGVSPEEFVEAQLAHAVGHPDYRTVTIHAPTGLDGATAVREPGQSDESFARSEELVNLLTGRTTKPDRE